MDEEWARYICDQEEKGEGTPPVPEDEPDLTPLGYSDVVARLDLIADRIMMVRGAVQAGYSQDHKEPSFTPLPRPVTALDRERERRLKVELEDVDALFRGEGLLLIG